MLVTVRCYASVVVKNMTVLGANSTVAVAA